MAPGLVRRRQTSVSSANESGANESGGSRPTTSDSTNSSASSPATKKLRCAINKENRTKSINHCTGSRSFVAARESKRKEDGAEPGRIEFYKITRFKNGKWISNEAEERYEKMVANLL